MVLALATECPHPPESVIAMVDTCISKRYGDLHVRKGVRLKLKIPLIH